MSIDEVLEVIRANRIIAIVRLNDLSTAIDLTHALLDGGIRALEFTLSNPDAMTALAEVKAAVSEFKRRAAVIGIGTVLNAEQARSAIEAGAQFIVSPTTNLQTIEMCQRLNVAVMPGAFTPTEILAAWEAGASAVKVFPARSLGPSYIKDVREPLPFLRLIPTGGIHCDNIKDYLRNGAFAVGVGGNLVDKQLVAAGAWDALTDRAREFTQAAW
ncbi:MAG TPA: bifunctional 4-hydroxy-2-oxoglutarate aldolase/2-dehydro-3-deoxy-phosphogluconate aldolase [Anaerolineae bacterium]|nr:bifunctional 4-hydroxy-2-oxoglutarate aldolase/2-dehydro-3-deoxy-phosphogluconate aldolase [Anaerolineae bacterium]